ncbi:hypothetical protein TanjilG_05440 [Lupinus angustifolius]|uniref:SAM domain-containing protein n=1 Tax=Lupinus angustifolius TaxID=3871 RepID=A0A4P1QSM7_LUPAN|nr:PREDICTED: uncharacterized protein LOC109331494 [Lupinus angustifolius]OIV94060.1 hypothetical protein TanjilG_05440 [Lupinus angustifolius]
MDWFSWLSKTSLEPSLVYEYGLAFAHNELEEEDIVYFNHEFLQSMGISIAKHRLEIIKLSRKDNKGSNRPLQVARLMVAMKKTKRFLANYIRRTMIRCEESTALVVVPSSSSRSSGYGTKRKKNSVMKRNKKMMVGNNKQEKLLLTNRSSPMEEKMDHGYWSASAVEDIRWDTMFKDLKPN